MSKKRSPGKPPRPAKRRIRYAVAGLGWFAQTAVLSAFAHARENSELAALVSDDPEKLEKLGRKYRVKALHSYADYPRCLVDREIDAVDVAVPDHRHRDFTVSTANEGIHVLCEKPMAVTGEECEDIRKPPVDEPETVRVEGPSGN